MNLNIASILRTDTWGATMGVIVNTLRYVLVDHPWSAASLVCAVIVAKVVVVLRKCSLQPASSNVDRRPQEITRQKQRRQEAADADEESDEAEDEVPAIAEDTQHVSYRPATYPAAEMVARSRQFYEDMNRRRSCRFFSSAPVPRYYA